MDLESILRRSPLVYTTPLEEMAIFKKDFNETRPSDIIKSIIAESKPIYKRTNSAHNAGIRNIKQEYDKDAISDHYDDVIITHPYWQRKPMLKLTFKKLKEKVKEIKTKSNSADNATKIVLISKKETNINAYNQDKLANLLAMCRPLKVVLKDIGKIIPKTNDEIKSQVINISSDSEDDVTLVGQGLIKDQTRINSMKDIPTNKNNAIKKHTTNYVIKNINDFKDILRKEDLQNCVIVIYNVYIKELDAYQINEWYKVTKYKTRKYSEINKFPMEKCRLIINIIACCWRNRQCYESILNTYTKYKDIVTFIRSTHPCEKRCKCCCFFVEQSPAFQGNVNKTGHAVNYNNSQDIITHNSKFIVIALKFKKNTKWTGYPAESCYFSDKNKSLENWGHTLFQLSNSKGVTEYYELGMKNEIYSKLIINGTDNSTWLSKTVTQCPSKLYCKFTDSIDREKQITSNKKLKNIISFNTECFLRKQIVQNNDEMEKRSRCSEFFLSYKIEHTRSFMRACNEKSKVVSISSALRRNKKAIRCNAITTRPQIQPPQSSVMEQDVSQTINYLIKGILHRFRNVLLTINSEGKVAAALNSQLNSLNLTELQILSQILNHAQSQVDKLGLTPGTCLNPDTPRLIHTNCSKPSVSTTDNISLKNSKQKIHATKQLSTHLNKRKQILSNFSKTIGQKKIAYEKSFLTYLSGTIRATPKITNIFSLNKSNCASDYEDPIRLSPFEENNIINDSGTSTERKNNSNLMSTNVLLNDIKEEITIEDNEIESMWLKERKRKTSSDYNIKPPKIRVRSAEEIIIKDSAKTKLVSANIVNPSITQTETVTPMAKTKSNYVSDDNHVLDLPVADREEKNILVESRPQQVLEMAAMPSYEIHADDTTIESKHFPKL